MRICIISNSHAACLMDAWSDVSAAHPGVEATFFASPAGGLASLTVQGDRLVTPRKYVSNFLKQTSGGQEAIAPSDFDACLVFGLRLDVPALEVQLSHAVVRQCCEDAVAVSVNRKICEMIRSISPLPVFSAHTPMPAASETDGERVAYEALFPLLRTPVEAEGAVFLKQPAATVATAFGTLREYSRGSRKLLLGSEPAQQHDQDEPRHMNAVYGHVFLMTFLDVLESSGLGV